jgi:hypothetical protein
MTRVFGIKFAQGSELSGCNFSTEIEVRLSPRFPVRKDNLEDFLMRNMRKAEMTFNISFEDLQEKYNETMHLPKYQYIGENNRPVLSKDFTKIFRKQLEDGTIVKKKKCDTSRIWGMRFAVPNEPGQLSWENDTKEHVLLNNEEDSNNHGEPSGDQAESDEHYPENEDQENEDQDQENEDQEKVLDFGEVPSSRIRIIEEENEEIESDKDEDENVNEGKNQDERIILFDIETEYVKPTRTDSFVKPKKDVSKHKSILFFYFVEKRTTIQAINACSNFKEETNFSLFSDSLL